MGNHSMGLKILTRENMLPLVTMMPLIVVPALHHVFNINVQPKPPFSPVYTKADILWPSRALTAKERVLASRFFGPNFKLDHIKVYDGGEQPEDFGVAAHAFNKTDMAFYGPLYYSPDYSEETNAFKFGAFFHELTHLLQFQKGLFTTANSTGPCKRLYEYVLEPGKRFEDYCSEQQATMVEDYARRFLMEKPASYRHKHMTAESDPLLKEIIETRFPGACELRAEAEDRRYWLLQDTLEALRLKTNLQFMQNQPVP